jgi:hypothetical protein
MDGRKYTTLLRGVRPKYTVRDSRRRSLLRVLHLSLVSGALIALALGLASCGGGKTVESNLVREAKAACKGPALSGAARLPPSWPEMSAVTFTRQATQGPTEVVEGHFQGDIETAHDAYKDELEDAGFTILFEEREDHDAEVSWKGGGRSGQVALREDCGRSDKIYVHITNRPAG